MRILIPQKNALAVRLYFDGVFATEVPNSQRVILPCCAILQLDSINQHDWVDVIFASINCKLAQRGFLSLLFGEDTWV